MHTLTLTPPASPETVTTIHIDIDAWKSACDLVPEESKAAVLYDAGVKEIADRVMSSLVSPVSIEVPSGDGSKSFAEAERMTTALLDAGCDRRTTIICIGGGMLTDLGGFVASVFMRGVPCVLIPTTLLGMVDAGIGGKTAVNVGGRKNMVGSVTHPEAVLIDLELLQTLPKKQLQEGLTEVIKIAAILDAPFFEWLEEHLDAVLAADPAALEQCVLRAVEAKVQVIEQDANDRDVRLLLNFGHTVGHAVEAYSRYRLSHGEAISIGMIAEMKLAGKDHRDVEALLKKVHMPCVLSKEYSREDLWKIMLTDKKNEGGVVKAAVPFAIGEGALVTLEKGAFLSLP